MAGDKGFVELVNKSESYEICFVPDNDYRGFLKRRMPGLEAEVAGGEFVMQDGSVVGIHEGYPFYTIGQRKGLGIALGFPVFVTGIDKETNRVFLGKDVDLMKNAMTVNQLSLMKYESLQGKSIETVTKVRYKDPGSAATATQIGDEMHVHFHDMVSAIAPGQAAVFYEGDDVIGGGWIQSGYRL